MSVYQFWCGRGPGLQGFLRWFPIGIVQWPGFDQQSGLLLLAVGVSLLLFATPAVSSYVTFLSTEPAKSWFLFLC